MDEIFLTELGQSQLTKVTFGFRADNIFDSEDVEQNGFGFYEAGCQGCGLFALHKDFGLCEEYTAKLDRNLIRHRDWDYSALAFEIPAEKREALCNEIIGRYGEKEELISPREKSQRKR